MIAGIVIAVIAAIVVIWAIAAYNGLVGQRNKVEEAFSTMDVYMKKRYDLIPNVVESVKGYAAHEKSTLDALVKARSAAAATGKAWVFPDDPQSALVDTLRLKRNKKGPLWEYLRKP